MTRSIVMIGATGLIGGMTAELLSRNGHEVHSLARRPAGLRGEIVASAREWPRIVRGLRGDVGLSAIGTTMRIAGSEAAFCSVDFDIAVSFAAAARDAGIRHMITISSVGANPGSRNFYLRTKGEMESALEALGFDRLDVLRPGLLRGERGPERRLGERLGILASGVVDPLLRGRLAKYASIDARIVAAAIAEVARAETPGLFVHHNRELRDIAGR